MSYWGRERVSLLYVSCWYPMNKNDAIKKKFAQAIRSDSLKELSEIISEVVSDIPELKARVNRSGMVGLLDLKYHLENETKAGKIFYANLVKYALQSQWLKPEDVSA